MDKLENCADCGKKFGFTERIFSKTNGLWICEDCAITQMQESDNKDQKIADLEAKLEESEETIRLLKMSNDALREDNLDLSYNQVDNVYETAIEISKGWESQYQQEIAQLKQQLEQKTSFGKFKSAEELLKAYQNLEREFTKSRQQLAEKEKEIERLTKSFAQKNNEDLSTTINGVKFTSEQIIALQQVGYSVEYDKNQTAIAELEKVKLKVRDVSGALALCEIEVQIDQQIKELKGESR